MRNFKVKVTMKRIEGLGISPAPWKVNDDGEIECHYVSNSIRPNDERSRVVARTNYHFYECEADARLIAAAPELYECLREAIEDKCHFCTANADERRELCDQCIVADWKDALAEAAGESEVK